MNITLFSICAIIAGIIFAAVCFYASDRLEKSLIKGPDEVFNPANQIHMCSVEELGEATGEFEPVVDDDIIIMENSSGGHFPHNLRVDEIYKKEQIDCRNEIIYGSEKGEDKLGLVQVESEIIFSEKDSEEFKEDEVVFLSRTNRKGQSGKFSIKTQRVEKGLYCDEPAPSIKK